MKAVIQRCNSARVEVDKVVVGQIGNGLTVFLGVEQGDDESTTEKLMQKVSNLRIFDDSDGKFNYAVRDVAGEVLVVSNFTLCGQTRKGTRPSFSTAAAPAEANRLYEHFVRLLVDQGIKVATGQFAASMRVLVENDGPVTLILEVSPTFSQ